MSRDRIVEMAIEIVTEEGYASLSMRYLADRLGTSTMGIYYYFASKNELLGYLFSRPDGASDEGQYEAQDPFERAVRAASTVARFLEVHGWALAGVLDGHVGIEELTTGHTRVLTESIRELGLEDDAAEETVRGIWRIVLGEALLRSAPSQTGLGQRAHASFTETIESYLVGRLARMRLRGPAATAVRSGA